MPPRVSSTQQLNLRDYSYRNQFINWVLAPNPGYADHSNQPEPPNNPALLYSTSSLPVTATTIEFIKSLKFKRTRKIRKQAGQFNKDNETLACELCAANVSSCGIKGSRTEGRTSFWQETAANFTAEKKQDFSWQTIQLHVDSATNKHIQNLGKTNPGNEDDTSDGIRH
ncbi:hypothetical protein MMC20_007979 [Loxospora ochrophaea]|nr:hypothetical protein [Loxospora ochrophaea]